METIERHVDQPRRLFRWMLLNVGSVVIALGFMNWLLDGFVTDGLGGLLIASVFISVALALLLPLASKAISWLPAILFPILIFAASGGIVLLAGWLDEALEIDAFELNGLESAIWVTLGLTAITTILGTLFSL